MLTRDSVETTAYHRIHLVVILTRGENECALIQLSKKTTFLVQKIKENALIGEGFLLSSEGAGTTPKQLHEQWLLHLTAVYRNTPPLPSISSVAQFTAARRKTNETSVVRPRRDQQLSPAASQTPKTANSAPVSTAAAARSRSYFQ